jgi:crossover junction endodeoxyribonuclease RusA
MPEPVTLTLPEPPSANRIWRNGRGRTYTSQAARDFKAAVLAAALIARIDRPVFHGPVRLTMTWYRQRKAGDLSNRIKVVEDALNGVVWDDDKQVAEIHVYRVDGQRPGRLEVTIADV